jgi:hypothetical protein
MDEIEDIAKRFKLSRQAMLFHSHHLDPAFNGRRLRRLPDMSLVYADEYEERLKEYESAQKEIQEEPDQTGKP